MHVHTRSRFGQHVSGQEAVLPLAFGVHDEAVFEVSFLRHALLLNACNWQLEVAVRLPWSGVLRRLVHPSHFALGLAIQIGACRGEVAGAEVPGELQSLLLVVFEDEVVLFDVLGDVHT